MENNWSVAERGLGNSWLRLKNNASDPILLLVASDITMQVPGIESLSMTIRPMAPRFGLVGDFTLIFASGSNDAHLRSVFAAMQESLPGIEMRFNNSADPKSFTFSDLNKTRMIAIGRILCGEEHEQFFFRNASSLQMAQHTRLASRSRQSVVWISTTATPSQSNQNVVASPIVKQLNEMDWSQYEEQIKIQEEIEAALEEEKAATLEEENAAAPQLGAMLDKANLIDWITLSSIKHPIKLTLINLTLDQNGHVFLCDAVELARWAAVKAIIPINRLPLDSYKIEAAPEVYEESLKIYRAWQATQPQNKTKPNTLGS